jgi:uncharacterized Ntn-hydrolase superfamily protein
LLSLPSIYHDNLRSGKIACRRHARDEEDLPMTVSVLARDPAKGRLGGAAVTGNLCVGGWVLRGDSRTGIVASQGEQPSTLWADAAADLLRAGEAAQAVVDRVVAPDRGRERRQLSVLTRTGAGACFTGGANRDWKGALCDPDLVIAGNILAGAEVLEAARQAFREAAGGMEDRLLAALRAAEASGGDSRGHLSAALLVVSDTEPPLTLRIDWDEAPLDALARLLDRARRPDYARWVAGLPVRTDPERHA